MVKKNFNDEIDNLRKEVKAKIAPIKKQMKGLRELDSDVKKFHKMSQKIEDDVDAKERVMTEKEKTLINQVSKINFAIRDLIGWDK